MIQMICIRLLPTSDPLDNDREDKDMGMSDDALYVAYCSGCKVSPNWTPIVRAYDSGIVDNNGLIDTCSIPDDPVIYESSNVIHKV